MSQVLGSEQDEPSLVLGLELRSPGSLLGGAGQGRSRWPEAGAGAAWAPAQEAGPGSEGPPLRNRVRSQLQ